MSEPGAETGGTPSSKMATLLHCNKTPLCTVKLDPNHWSLSSLSCRSGV